MIDMGYDANGSPVLVKLPPVTGHGTCWGTEKKDPCYGEVEVVAIEEYEHHDAHAPASVRQPVYGCAGHKEPFGRYKPFV